MDKKYGWTTFFDSLPYKELIEEAKDNERCCGSGRDISDEEAFKVAEEMIDSGLEYICLICDDVKGSFVIFNEDDRDDWRPFINSSLGAALYKLTAPRRGTGERVLMKYQDDGDIIAERINDGKAVRRTLRMLVPGITTTELVGLMGLEHKDGILRNITWPCGHEIAERF